MINEIDPDITLTLILVSPELICLLILITTLINILLYKNHQDNIKITKLEIIGIIIRLISVLATLFVLTLYNADFVLFNNQYVINNKLLFIKMVTVAIIIIVLFILHDNIENDPNLSIELLVMCLISLIGMFIMISANDLLILAIGLELQTIPYFIFCCLKRSSNISVEAGLKYFIYACFCSAILLYGISLIFGLFGTINFIELQNILDINNKNLPLNTLLFSLSCILVGLLFKLGVFPFHSWIPDIYEGSPNIITFFFAVIPKITVVLALNQIFFITFLQYSNYFCIIFLISGLCSIAFGSISAIYQVKIKKLLAYSTIVHMGYILICFSVGSVNFAFAYLLIYIFILINFFSIYLVIYRTDKSPMLNIVDCVSLLKTNPILSIIFCISLLSLAGIPPLAGFFGKLALFIKLINTGDYFVCCFIILFSVLSVIYYIRLIRMCWFSEEVGKNPIEFKIQISFKQSLIISIFTFLNIFFIFYQIILLIDIISRFIC